MKKRFRGIFGFWLLLIVFLGGAAHASAPKMDAPITKANILALMDAYDQDSAYILRSTQSDSQFLYWWNSEDTIAGGIDTGVHEQFHAYTFQNVPWNSENIYLGGMQTARVTYTNVFPSRQMAVTIPGNLRTFRWSTYVGEPVPDMASDKYGVYGLLNEFSAYYWGMHAQMSLLDYYKANHATRSQWLSFVSACANDRLAYAEFKYYTLHYLAYAKQHRPDVYNEIMNNSVYVNTYKTMESRFAALIRQFEQYLNGGFADAMRADGYSASVSNGSFYIYSGASGYGTGIFQDDYDMLVREMQKSQYQGIFGASAPIPVKVGDTAVTSVKSTAKGISISWKRADGADGYYVYRKGQGEGKYTKVKSAAGTSWTDTKVDSNRQYLYKVVPCAKDSSGKIIQGKAAKSPVIAWVKVPTISSVETGSGRRVKISWKKVTSASGYQIMYSSSPDFSSAKKGTVKGNLTSKTFRVPKAPGIYFIKMRACWKKSSGETYRSDWSDAKMVIVF